MPALPGAEGFSGSPPGHGEGEAWGRGDAAPSFPIFRSSPHFPRDPLPPADGCNLHEVTIGIKQNIETVIRAAILAVTNAKLALGTANALVSTRYDTLQAADDAGYNVLRNCRLRLVKVLGSQYNSGWQTAGWPNQSTAVPDNQDQRFTLLGALNSYFTANPTAASAEMEATAAICAAAHTAISNARQAVNTAESDQTTAQTNEKAAIKTLRKRVRGLIEELGTLVADDDARYEAFGLNIPANPSAPEGIATLTLSALGGGKVFLQWEYAARMTGTRIMRKRIGVDDEFASVGTVSGLEKLLSAQTAGQTIEFFVVPYNDGGDGPQSPTESVVVV
jgi:hypothetical protein